MKKHFLIIFILFSIMMIYPLVYVNAQEVKSFLSYSSILNDEMFPEIQKFINKISSDEINKDKGKEIVIDVQNIIMKYEKKLPFLQLPSIRLFRQNNIFVLQISIILLDIKEAKKSHLPLSMFFGKMFTFTEKTNKTEV